MISIQIGTENIQRVSHAKKIASGSYAINSQEIFVG